MADVDLGAAAALVKPALLYADRVTIYSPAAALVNAMQTLGAAEPREQLLALYAVAQYAPSMRATLPDEAAVARFLPFLETDRRLLRSAAQANGIAGEIDGLYDQIDEVANRATAELPKAVEDAIATVGGEEVVAAASAGVLTVADIAGASGLNGVGEAVRAALGDTEGDGAAGNMFAGWLGHVVDMLNDAHSFPLLDAQASTLVRSLAADFGLQAAERALRHGSEVTAASQFMGFLPYFPDLPLDEVLALRRELANPLSRFRVEMAKIAHEFEARQFDEAFVVEVKGAWRSRVAPALADIREALHEHGLLREAASIARGDAGRLLAEAGGVLATASMPSLNLSHLLAAALAAAPPAAEVIGRAINARRTAREVVATNAFYLLHRLSDEAMQRRSA